MAEQYTMRQERTKPIVENIRKKLLAAKAAAPPKSKLGEGIGDGLSQWPQLSLFLDHAEIELSNNQAENSIRPVALGWKNWIHVGSVDG